VHGSFFTVSFSDEIEPRRELLRHLAFNYRTNATEYRRYINGLLADATALQVCVWGWVWVGGWVGGGGVLYGRIVRA
jgi:hypothetical protein